MGRNDSVVWGRREPSAELVELIALVHEIGRFLMGMDAKLDRIVELLGGEDGEEGNRADS
jgi:hypothetical protein